MIMFLNFYIFIFQLPQTIMFPRWRKRVARAQFKIQNSKFIIPLAPAGASLQLVPQYANSTPKWLKKLFFSHYSFKR